MVRKLCEGFGRQEASAIDPADKQNSLRRMNDEHFP
jgi:hypothetical protein